MAEIPTYPVENENLQRAMNIQQDLDRGVPMLKNPATETAAAASTAASGLSTSINAALTTATGEKLVALTALGAAVGGLVDAGSGLMSHMDTMLFGDDSDSPISGGMASNLSQANSANTLKNSTSGVQATCDLFEEFFGSILGAAKELFNRINSVIAAALGVVNAAISAIYAVIAQIQALINEAIAMVAREIQAAIDWLQRQLDLAFGAMLAALKSIPCVGDVLSEVATESLSVNLSIPL